MCTACREALKVRRAGETGPGRLLSAPSLVNNRSMTAALSLSFRFSPGPGPVHLEAPPITSQGPYYERGFHGRSHFTDEITETHISESQVSK